MIISLNERISLSKKGPHQKINIHQDFFYFFWISMFFLKSHLLLLLFYPVLIVGKYIVCIYKDGQSQNSNLSIKEPVILS